MRLIADRGLHEVWIGSAAEPSHWFNAEEVRAYLKRTPERLVGFDADLIVGLLGEFLSTDLDELIRLFSRNEYPNTRRALMDVRRVKNRELFGPNMPTHS